MGKKSYSIFVIQINALLPWLKQGFSYIIFFYLCGYMYLGNLAIYIFLYPYIYKMYGKL